MEPHQNKHEEAISSNVSLEKNEQFHVKANGVDDPPSMKTILVRQKSNKLDDEYVVIGRIGSGIYGDVFKIRHKELGLIRALKVIKKDPSKKHSQKQEIEVLKGLDHPNILKIYQFYQLQNFYYIVTELFDGKQLYNQILEHGIFSQLKAAETAHQILKALVYTHKRKIVHRDIKLQNILIKSVNGVITIKLIDWGFGSFVKDKLMRVCGTHEYAAPDIFEGHYDQKCDMWSFGVLLFVLLSGTFPFRGSTKQETINLIRVGKFSFQAQAWKTISNQAKNFINSLLTKNSSQRISAQEALNSLWITKHQKKQFNIGDLKDTLTNFTLVHIRNSITAAAINFITNYLSSQQQKQKLNQVFNMLDTNGDGVLSFDEIAKGYEIVYGPIVGQTIAQQTFAKLDLNHNGTLQYNQFITYSLDLKKNFSGEKMKAAFKIFDNNKDGVLNMSEMKQIFSYDPDIFDQHIIKNWLDDLDYNGDGRVDQNQFIKALIQICTLVKNNDNLQKQLDQQSKSKNKLVKDNEQKQKQQNNVATQKCKIQKPKSITDIKMKIVHSEEQDKQ